MAKSGSRYMVIKVDTQTGKVVTPPEDENGKKAVKVSQKEINEIYQGKTGFKYVAEVLHAHNSPGCIYINLGGWWFKICR
jgi:hypothetical protein